MIENKPEIDREKLKRYLLLFGLKNSFSVEELSASFRTLAKLNHPDVRKDKDSVRTMTDINEGYHFLKEALSRGFTGGFSKDFQLEPERERVEDIFYTQYKKGFSILKRAFENYYGESEDKSFSGKSDILIKELMRAKIEFATLINDLPYNQWVNDAIDKINSINKWLS